MAANGISTLADKQARQVAKLDIAEAKRQGKVVDINGNITGAVDNTKPYFRVWNILDINALSAVYNVNTSTDAGTYNPLQPHRPWLTSTEAVAPETVEEAIPQATYDQIITNYDAATNTYIKPPGTTSGGSITQWLDQSVFAHNLNSGGSARPTWHDAVQNGKGAIRFDGINDELNINPVSWLNSMSEATFFVVAKPNSTTGETLMGSDQNDLRIYSDAGSWKVGCSGATAQQASGTDADITATNWYYMTVCFDGAGATDADRLRFKVNGTQITLSFTGSVGTTTNASNTEFVVGGYNGAEFFDGDVGELIIFDIKLIDPEIASVENYLKTRWGI